MSLVPQFFMFSMVGVAAGIGHYTALLLLVEIGRVAPVPASLAGSLLGALISYVLNYRYTFQSSKRHHEALTRFLIVAGIGILLNAGAMAVLTGPLAIHYLIAQIIATGLVVLWSFSCSRYWTFRESPSR